MVALFTGIETYTWAWSDFQTCIDFCKANDIDTWYLKIYEITQGEWYSSIQGAMATCFSIEKQGIKVVPYGFFYGDDPVAEGQAISKYLAQWHDFCIDVEGSFDNNPDKMQRLVDQIQKTFGKLHCSTWANPNTHGYTQCLKVLDKVVDVWLPQCYDDSLLKEFFTQWISSVHPVQPTFHVVNTPYNDAKSFPSFSLWEYQLAQQNVGALQSYMAISKGNSVGTYPTNSLGMVANFVPVTEFQPGKSEFECGAFSVALCSFATNQDTPNPQKASDLIYWAEQEYLKTTGSNGPSNTAGASIPDMWTMLKDTQARFWNGQPNGHLHYWDIASITPGSTQDNDIAQIKAAIQHGYPVIATVSEKSVYDVQLKANPYWWGATGNHILVWVGIAPSGNLLAVDPANVIRGDGNLQTPKTVQSWPREYDIKSIDNQWATIVEAQWLPNIPNDNPVSWPPYFVAPPPPPPDQIFGVSVTYDETSKQLIYSCNNQVILRQAVS